MDSGEIGVGVGVGELVGVGVSVGDAVEVGVAVGVAGGTGVAVGAVVDRVAAGCCATATAAGCAGAETGARSRPQAARMSKSATSVAEVDSHCREDTTRGCFFMMACIVPGLAGRDSQGAHELAILQGSSHHGLRPIPETRPRHSFIFSEQHSAILGILTTRGDLFATPREHSQTKGQAIT